MTRLSELVAVLVPVSDTPDLDARLLLESVTGKSQAYWLAHSDFELTSVQQANLDALVGRRQAGEPIAYLLGQHGFWSMDLNVTPDVLIPRPETECLVEWVLDQYSKDSVLKVADLGTGSGCIAIALACERPRWTIHAADYSEAALAVAKNNAEQYHGHAISFYQGDWCEALPEAQYDLIVSNPPYIAENDVHLEALQYEPLSALTAGVDGFVDIEIIVDQASCYLKRGGALVVEHGFDQAEGVVQFFKKTAYADVQSHFDLAGQRRFVSGVKN